MAQRHHGIPDDEPRRGIAGEGLQQMPPEPPTYPSYDLGYNASASASGVGAPSQGMAAYATTHQSPNTGVPMQQQAMYAGTTTPHDGQGFHHEQQAAAPPSHNAYNRPPAPRGGGGPQSFQFGSSKGHSDLSMETLQKRATTVAGGMAVMFLLFVLMSGTGPAFYLLPVLTICSGGIYFAWWLARYVLTEKANDENMIRISDAIKNGSEGFLKIQYGSVSKLAGCFSIFVVILYLTAHSTPKGLTVTPLVHAVFTACSFLLGAGCSCAAGYVGMWVSVRANIRVACAAKDGGYRPAFLLALRGGAFSAVAVVALCIFGISALFFLAHIIFIGDSVNVEHLPFLLVGYGFGASFVALFAQLGGGIYTKAADVGADLVGKVESGIPEDDPRNPAVIADLVGDNVGDCAGSCADIFESIAGETIGAMILGGTMTTRAGIPESALAFMVFPLVVHAFDIVASGIGIMMVNPKGHNHHAEDPMTCLKKGYMFAVVIASLGLLVSTRILLYTDRAPDAWWHFFFCGLVGVANGFAFVYITQYYTDYIYGPVRRIAAASTSGHATNIIAGVSVGLESTALPVLSIATAVIASHALGESSGLVDGRGVPIGGLFGVACATMGMLSTGVYVLTTNNFGPIADNAGGIVEMAQLSEDIRDITDRLDAAGNVTKATTKGYSVGSAGLACILMFNAFLEEFSAFAGEEFTTVNIAVPEVLVGGLLGVMLIFLFSSWAIAAVGNTAEEVVMEVRRQFEERPGIMYYTESPDYEKCVSIVTKRGLSEMIKPGLLATGMPVVVGFVFKFYGSMMGKPVIAPQILSSFLMFATLSGLLMATYFNNAGGAWDNAKKYVETGAHGGKGTEAHHAAVTGDTVGDPFKDTAGPSLHILIKLLSTILLMLGPLFI